jgi:hypothetical protein
VGNRIRGEIHVMKSAFGSKRKPRKIEVDEEDDGLVKDSSRTTESTNARMYMTFLQKRTADGRCCS